MKLLTSLFLMLFISVLVRSQDQKTLILNQLKAKKIDSLIQNCDLPFTWSGFSMQGNEVIKDSSLLAKKFKELVKRKYFEPFLASRKVIKKGNEVIFQVNSYNSDGEMESESSLGFSFRKGKDGKWKLWEISMAG